VSFNARRIIALAVVLLASTLGGLLTVAFLDETLPSSRIVVMAGHGHAAMDTGTDLFTNEVLRFVEATWK
jgi:putative copper export protein